MLIEQLSKRWFQIPDYSITFKIEFRFHDLQFKTFVEIRIQILLSDVRLLFSTMCKDSSWEKFYYHERITESIWIKRNHVSGTYHLHTKRIVI